MISAAIKINTILHNVLHDDVPLCDVLLVHDSCHAPHVVNRDVQSHDDVQSGLY